MRLRLSRGHLDDNRHAWRKRRGGPLGSRAYVGTAKRSTISFCILGRDGWLKAEGRKLWGLRLWIYGPTGACVHFDVAVLFDRSPCAPGSRYGPSDDGGNGTVML